MAESETKFMKVLYISSYLGFSGYAAAARGYVRALHKSGVDLVLRYIKYDDGKEYQLEDWDRKLFTRTANDVDVILQHTTPNELAVQPEGKRNAKHIGMLATETDLISNEWAQSLNRMDAVITFCPMSADAIRNAGVKVPVYVVPHTFEIDQYSADIEPFHTLTGLPLEGEDKPCIFYNISQISHKKGIDKLLRAYWGAFQNGENVTLVLKGYIGQMKRVNEDEQILNFLNEVKDGTRLPTYPRVLILHDILGEREIQRLHATCDAYVNASNGEGWSLPLFEAAAHGNAVVSTKWGGPEVFLNDHEFYSVRHSIEPVYNMKHSFQYMFTSRENWAEPSVTSMIEQIRLAYKDYQSGQLRKVTGLERFDDSVIGPQLLGILEEICTKEAVPA